MRLNEVGNGLFTEQLGVYWPEAAACWQLRVSQGGDNTSKVNTKLNIALLIESIQPWLFCICTTEASIKHCRFYLYGLETITRLINSTQFEVVEMKSVVWELCICDHQVDIKIWYL